MTEEEKNCLFCKKAIDSLLEEKKEEVMKTVGEFVINPKIKEINKEIAVFQQKCTHLKLDGGKCAYCKKQIINLKSI